MKTERGFLAAERLSLRLERNLALVFAALGVLLTALMSGYWLLVLEPSLRADAESRTRAMAQAQARTLEVVFGLEPSPQSLVAELNSRIDRMLLLKESEDGPKLTPRIEIELDPEVFSLPPERLRFAGGQESCVDCFVVDVPLYHPRDLQLVGIATFYGSTHSLRQLIGDVRSKLMLTGGGILVLIALAWLWAGRLLRRLSESDANVRNLLDVAPFPILLLETDHQRIGLANQAAQRYLALNPNATGHLDSVVWHEVRARALLLSGKERTEVKLSGVEGQAERWAMLSATQVNVSGAVHQLLSLVDVSDLKAIQQRLHLAANTDALTQSYNRRFLFEQLREDIDRAASKKHALSVILLDLDKFKAINDTFGHAVGDEVLIKTAEVLQQSIRTGDTCGRYGGEEFLVILPSATRKDASEIAERIRASIENLPPLRPGLKLSISGGLAEYQETAYQATGIDGLLEAADRKLYQAKEQGRNRVIG